MRSTRGKARKTSAVATNTRPTKRKRRTPTKTTLLDLPDNVLFTILTLLQRSTPEPAYSRGLESLRHSFALAQTCQRLLSIFGETLYTIDAEQPVSLLGRAAHLPPCASPAHLTVATRYAASSLRVMRLPRFFLLRSKTKARSLLKNVTENCPSIRELSFVDEGIINTVKLSSGLFGTKLSKLEVCGPTVKTLEALRASTCCLTELALLDVDGPSISKLSGLLEAKGATLQTLQVGIDMPYPDLMASPDANGPVESFLLYLYENATKDLPLLETLDIEAFTMNPPEELYSQVFAGEIQRLTDLIAAVLDRNREINSRMNRTAALLSELRIHGLRGKVPGYLELLKNLLTRDVDVEVDFPGATVVFPAPTTEQQPYFRSVQLANAVPDYPEMFGHMLSKLETVELSSSLFSTLWPEGVKLIIRGASAHIRNIAIRCHVRFGERSWDDEFRTCRYLVDVLVAAPNVERLTLPNEIVTYSRDHHFHRMISLCRNLRVLHLYESGYSRLCFFTGQREPRTGPLVSYLPDFLAGVRQNCPRLRSLYMEEAGNLRDNASGKELKRNLRAALNAVDEFEAALPLADAGTVRAHIHRWMRPPI